MLTEASQLSVANKSEISLEEVQFCLKLYFTQFNSIKRTATISTLIKEQGGYAGDPSKRKYISHLINAGILIQHGIDVLGNETYYLKRIALEEFINQQEIAKLFSSFKDETAILIE